MEKKGFLDKLIDLVMKMSAPLAKFARLPIMRALQEGMMGALPMLMVGSIFVLLGALVDGGAGFAPLAFLGAFGSKFYVAYNVGIGFMGLYVCVATAIAYAKIQGVSELNASVVAIGGFLALSFNDFYSGFSISMFGQTGMLVGIIASLCSVKLYAVLVQKNLVIKLPDVVPANIANSFLSLIPAFLVITLGWTIRTVLEFDVLTFIGNLIGPIISASDSMLYNFINGLISSLFWSVGLHYSNMVSGFTMPISTLKITANYEAFMAGTAATELPYITAGSYNWYSAFSYGFSLIFLLWRSKTPGFKDIAKLAVIPAFFNIFEPLWFGLPVILNPIMMPAMIITWTITNPTSYIFFKMGWVNRQYLSAPWAAPCFLQGFITTGGDWRSLLVIAFNFVLCLIIWYPFVKAYERKVALEQQEQLKQEANA